MIITKNSSSELSSSKTAESEAESEVSSESTQEESSESEAPEPEAPVVEEPESQVAEEPIVEPEPEVVEETTNTYTVKAGDNLYRIALNHNMTTDELKSLNGISGDSVSVGTVLKVN